MIDEEIVKTFFDIEKIDRRYTQKHNYTIPGRSQYRIILTLLYHGPSKQNQIAGILGIRSTSLSELLLKLMDKGWIKREVCSNDKRTYQISLTKEGFKKATEFDKFRATQHHKMVESLNHEEKEKLLEILTKIKNHYLKIED